uniref:NADH-ubiquinone oxidoreductase chain 5 n=1 Tax=Physosmaragdina nigrifrons TaxID=1453301 RepID=A0A890CDK7_9CUCU|nr:NADH dehydrogenase subunit 5 [Physosmaragdina nigrifrons]QRG29984.1 NADH dehydrogenase subunit 5 [Physosmaragdina nigrifrons]
MNICMFYFGIFMILSLSFFFNSLMFLSYDYSIILEFNLLTWNSSCVEMTILLDWMSLMFMSFVCFISGAVIFYSEEYMFGDLNLNRFILLVVMFVLSMILLIISPNLISILLGWDGLGLVSYCLVIYYQNVKSFNAGMLTALTNRIGDVALLMAIAWMFNFGSWSFFYYLEACSNDYAMMMISWLVMLAALTKSAQIPFSSWLPAAMAAPTPVSSLVHSSTLVTAGVYLLIRFNFCFSNTILLILLFLSSMTMFMSGLGANFEYDLKKIIALSTLSQLGLMMSTLSLGGHQLAFFHLLTHALFKALLFMCAGSIIHSSSDAQDIRYFGGLINQSPYTITLFNVCNFSLCGLPFLSGFYSKDLIVEFMSMGVLNLYIYIIFYLSIGLTVSYSIRLCYYSLIGNYNFMSLNSLSEESFIMFKGMGGLIFFVVFSGSMLMWLLFKTPYFILLPLTMKMMTLIMIVMGGWLGYEAAKTSLNYSLGGRMKFSVIYFLGSMWNMPIISTLGVSLFPLYSGKMYYFISDQGWTEFYGPSSIVMILKKISLFLQDLSTNQLKIYFLLIVMWIFFILLI